MGVDYSGLGLGLTLAVAAVGALGGLAVVSGDSLVPPSYLLALAWLFWFFLFIVYALAFFH